MKRIKQAEVKRRSYVKGAFLMVDEVDIHDPKKKVVGRKHFSGKEGFLEGHFPGNPIVPGHIIAEVMVQVCSVFFYVKDQKPRPDSTPFLSASKTKFFYSAVPPATIRVTAQALKVLSIGGVFEAEAWAGRKLLAKGKFTMALIKGKPTR